jgi:hypothetical protein
LPSGGSTTIPGDTLAVPIMPGIGSMFVPAPPPPPIA